MHIMQHVLHNDFPVQRFTVLRPVGLEERTIPSDAGPLQIANTCLLRSFGSGSSFLSSLCLCSSVFPIEMKVECEMANLGFYGSQ